MANPDEILALRWAAVAIFLAVLPFAVYFRVKSQATGEALDRRQEGVFILATLRPAAGAYFIGLFCWMINPHSMEWSAVPLPIPLRWAGVGLEMVAAALWIWTFRTLGPNLTDTVVTRKKHVLVIRGPYRWIRHPFYVCVALLTMALAVVAANWFLVAMSAVVVGLLVIRTSTEERNLIARFGSDYESYMRRTGRFLPRMWRERE